MKKLLRNTSHRTWHRVGIALAMLILVGLMASAIAVISYNRAHNSEEAGGLVPHAGSTLSGSASPSQQASCTPKPMVAVPMTAAGKKGPAKQQVAGFLSAAVLTDPDQRNVALIPFATCEYIISSLDGGDDDADAPDNLEVTVNTVVVRASKVTGDTATVTASFGIETRQDGQLVDQVKDQTYTVVWVWTPDGWRVYTEAE